jgi:hypothetical protein
VVGAGAKVMQSRLSGSMIGDAAQVSGIKGQLNVSDHSVVKHEGV